MSQHFWIWGSTDICNQLYLNMQPKGLVVSHLELTFTKICFDEHFTFAKVIHPPDRWQYWQAYQDADSTKDNCTGVPGAGHN